LTVDDDGWLSLTDDFHAAAVDGDGWYEALAKLAEATGSRHGQLVCFTSDGDWLNVLTNVDPQLHRDFLAAGGADPGINPRRRAGLARSPLIPVSESDFITPEGMKKDRHYREFAVPWDVPFICLTTLERRDDMSVGLAVIRNRKQGHIGAEQKQLFASLAPHVRAAVRTSLALGAQREQLLAESFERLSMAALIVNSAGQVLRLTPAIETLCAEGRHLTIRQGRLVARRADDHALLMAAITSTTARRAGMAPRSVIVHHLEADERPITVDVLPVTSQRLELRPDSHALLVVRAPMTSDRRRVNLLYENFGMTAAEVEIALALLKGQKADAIARARGVSVGTVRIQIKSLLAKAGVKRQIELVARLAGL
jgi:DNA-binding CsgD family transcriptional regulator